MVSGLILVQILVGVITAHYGVEGMRVPGDTLFALGAIALAWFVVRQTISSSRQPVPRRVPEPATAVIPG